MKFFNEEVKKMKEEDCFIGERGNVYGYNTFANIDDDNKELFLCPEKLPIFFDENENAYSGILPEISIPRLVYSYFAGPVADDEEIYHIDGNKHNIHYSNLGKRTWKKK